jgi:Tfp pilus assembly protein PilF
MLGCSSNSNDIEVNTDKNMAHFTHVTLSHVKAYLLLGNIKKSEQLFQTIEKSELNAQAMLVLAEIHAANGNSMGAQQAFLLALTDDQFDMPINKTTIPTDLLNYFCAEKKWPALQGYGAAIVKTESHNSVNLPDTAKITTRAITKIGLCFFHAQRWDEAKHWLEKVNDSQQMDPLIYLALARANIELQRYSDAQRLITLYEKTKDNVDAKTMWTAIEVYMALKQPDMVVQLGENMRSLFSYNKYTRKYILLTKRGRLQAIVDNPIPAAPPSLTPIQSKRSDMQGTVHIIKKGETLYQLTQKYKVTVAQLLLWNPNLAINKISIGTSIKLESNLARTK